MALIINVLIIALIMQQFSFLMISEYCILNNQDCTMTKELLKIVHSVMPIPR